MSATEGEPEPIRPLGPGRLFLRDVGRVGAACRFDPRLALVVVVLSLLTALPGAVTLGDRGLAWMGMLGGVVGLATLGVLGAERAWFVAADRRESFTWTEVRSTARLMWGRYVGLGLYAALLTAVVLIPVTIVGVLIVRLFHGDDYDVAFRVGLTVSALAIEVVLTFATVVRVFSDISARDAVRHSLYVIRVEWPSSLWYAVAAPFTIQAFVLALPQSSVGVGVRVATLVVTAVIRLFCVGAVALFWADRYMMAGIES